LPKMSGLICAHDTIFCVIAEDGESGFGVAGTNTNRSESFGCSPRPDPGKAGPRSELSSRGFAASIFFWIGACNRGALCCLGGLWTK
jgi:hypothetical protein